jgi:hypothetical protein
MIYARLYRATLPAPSEAHGNFILTRQRRILVGPELRQF